MAKSFKKYILILLITLFLITSATTIFLLFLQEEAPITTNTEITSDTPEEIIVSGDQSQIVDTGQTRCYNNEEEIPCPNNGETFYGQDALYTGKNPSYTNNNDGTITDNITGLMWQKDPGEKVSYYEGISATESFELGGYTDWRVPTIKELYTLTNFSGIDPDPMARNIKGLSPFIDDSIFTFRYGDPSTADRIIDSQWITSNIYNSTVMNNEECFFGFNFADGRIKCYPTAMRNNGYYLIHVRGDAYGENDFIEFTNNTILDKSTELYWQKKDSGTGMNWEDALSYCENLELDGYSDWRLPNTKELQNIVDYSRSPDITNSPAIDGIFKTTTITNELSQPDYPYFWTSTTHIGVSTTSKASRAVYISLGRAMGKMNGRWMDVHGAGAQRSDPKDGNPSLYEDGLGPQGDAIRIYNYVRCVRGGSY